MELAIQNLALPDSTRARIVTAFHDGHQDALFALLLLSAPRLRALLYYESGIADPTWCSFLPSDLQNNGYLTHLRSLTRGIDFFEGGLPELFSHFRHLISLPTLRELEIVDYMDEWEDENGPMDLYALFILLLPIVHVA